MKILHVVTSLGLGGAERIAVDLAAECAGRHDVQVAGIFSVAPAYAAIRDGNMGRLAAAGVPVTEFGLRRKGPQVISALAGLHGLIRAFGPDVVHSHTDIPDAFVSLARRLVRFTPARTIHNTILWPGRTFIPRLVEAPFKDDLVVAVSEGARDAYFHLRRHVGRPASRFVAVVPNGIAPPGDGDLLSAAEAGALFGAAGPDIRLGFIGRLAHQKGLDLLLQALARLEPSLRDNLALHVIGDGPDRGTLEGQAAGLPVIFHGAQANARRLMPAFDLLIFPSRHEGLPTVALEALMAGVPALMSDAPGIREVPRTDDALTFASANPAALADALRLCLAQLPRLKAGAQALAADARRTHSAARMAHRYEALYADHRARTGGGAP